jgi:acetylornithine/succinyldiaminopimelate/putrescine aminotransferase
MEVAESTDTKALSAAFLDCGILTKETRSCTFRFAPPLIISESQVDEIVKRTELALDRVSPRVAASVG